MNINDIYRNRLKNLMEDKKITQYELFKKSGVPRSTICTILKGKGTIKLDTIYNLCFGLNIPLDEFFDKENFGFNKIDV